MDLCPLCFLGLEFPHSKEDWEILKEDDVQQRLDDEGWHEKVPHPDDSVWDPVVEQCNMRWMAEHNASEVESKWKEDNG